MENTSTWKEFIVDMQGFQGHNDQFILKEIAATDLFIDNYCVSHIFLPPFEFNELSAKHKSTYAWLYRNFHGLSWDTGYMPYDQVDDVIKSMLSEANVIYVKGAEKKKFLDNILKVSIDVINLSENNKCPKLTEISDILFNCHCPYEKHAGMWSDYNCDVKNVQLLKFWLCISTYDK